MKVSTAQALKDAGYPQKAIHRRGNPRGAWRRNEAGEWGRTDTLYIPDVKDLIEELTKSGAIICVSCETERYIIRTLSKEFAGKICNTDLTEALAACWLKVNKSDG